ncbi:tetratricopeptide repeat protein [Lacipirellula parvula]|uniref:tetratricopeptide repeat protein n=1 Tax=Lacipirellula parvula TaxID=2650471 RepID=UPI001562987D|nr:tetratricopeptide repeat protein [Lacipirellula parvula]
MTATPPQKTEYAQLLDALLHLHELEKTHLSESDDAERLRDLMEGHWKNLTDQEKNRLTGLSQDLYSISEPPKKPNPPTRSEAKRVSSQLRRVVEARKRGEWDSALSLIREIADRVQPDAASYMRGNILSDAGESQAALVFLQHAHNLDPSNGNYEAIYLNKLHEVSPADAEVEAANILASGGHATSVVLKAIDIRYSFTRRQPDFETTHELKTLSQKLQGILQSPDVAGEKNPSLYSMACGLLGFIYDHLGNYNEALSAYNRGIEANPTNDGLIVARGILQYGKTSESISDFERAVNLKTTLTWPYFYLAHDSLLNHEFNKCRQLSEHALSMQQSNWVKAELFEWIAICKAELGLPSPQVEAAFVEALKHDPQNRRISSNYNLFITGADKATTLWNMESAEVVRQLGQRGFDLAIAA